MTPFKLLALSLSLTVAAGCAKKPAPAPGPGPGPIGSKRLTSLSSTETAALCQEAVDVEMAPRTVECPDGSTTELAGKSECIAALTSPHLSASCAVTYDEAEDCWAATNEDPCNFGGSACSALIACIIP